MLEVSAGERILFPPFHLDLAAGRLACGSEPIELAPKAFGLLRYLAERPGQLVSKEELLPGIWPDVQVGPDVLKVTISEIRKVLADPSKEPRIIETAPRRGYRFIARTGQTAAAPAPETDVPPTLCPQRRRKHRLPGSRRWASRPGFRDGLGLASRVFLD